jgi:putative phage-type endonuclease
VSTATLTPPPAVVIAAPGIPRDEWLAIRKRGIGGSDVAAICGLDRYRSPFGVYLEKLDEVPDDAAGEAAEWGNILESVVAEHFSRRTGLRLIPSPGTLASVERPWQQVNVDALYAHPNETDASGVLEVKTRSAFVADQWGEDSLPDGPQLQVQHALDVTGLGEGHVAVLIGGQRYKHYRVHRDDELIAHLRQIERDFWQRIADRNPPPVDASKACTDLLAHLYEVKPDSVVELDPAEARQLLDERAEAKADIKAAEERCALAENQLKSLIGENEVGCVDGTPAVTWKRIAANRFDQAAFKADHPQMFQTYTRPSPYRRFNVPTGGQR